MIKKAYLLAYNLAQIAGWCYVGVLLAPHLQHFVKTGRPSVNTYNDCCHVLRVFQTVAYLEVVHNILGIVKSNPVLTFAQVTSRVVIACVVTDNFQNAQVSPAYNTMLLAWTISEIVRYSYYAMGILDVKLYALTWMRYTFFIVLYPVGVASELAVLYAALPQVKASPLMSYEMPNKYNATFSLYYALIIFALSYLPGFPQLYFHMVAQRRKVIGGRGSQPAAAAAATGIEARKKEE